MTQELDSEAERILSLGMTTLERLEEAKAVRAKMIEMGLRPRALADILFEKKGDGAELTLKVVAGPPIAKLKVRMPSASGYVWREKMDVRDVRVQ